MKLDTFWQELLAAVIIGVFIGAVVQNWERDDTDQDQPGGERSSMTIFTDHGTGCQYLGRAFTALIPRLDKDGNHVCDQE